MSSIESAAGFARENPRIIAAAVATVVTAGLYANAAPQTTDQDCTNEMVQQVHFTDALDPFKIARNLSQDDYHFTDLPGLNLQGGFFDQMASRLSNERGYTVSSFELSQDNDGLQADAINADSEFICLNIPAPVAAGEELTGEGETLTSIADDYVMTVDALRTLNPTLAETDIDTVLEEGRRIRLSADVDTGYVLQTAQSNLSDTARSIGAPVVDLVARNYGVFANGGTITDGDEAYIPLQQTSDMLPADILNAYVTAGSYTIPAQVAPAPVEAPAAPEAVQTELNEAQIQLIEAIPNRTPEQIQFIKDIYGGALQLQAQGYTINAGAFTAQIICESNWGTSQLTVQDNNFAGLKAPRGTPVERVAYWPTQEFLNGQYVTIDAAFLHADTQLQGLQDVADFWRKPWYDEQGVNAHMIPTEGEDYRSIAVEVFQGLHDGGWATSPTYVDTLTSIYDANDLAEVEAARTTQSEFELAG